MQDITRVYLITGFLGSGKTTFLNRIIKHFPKNKKLTVLVNEFGEIGIDGTLIKGEDIDMIEISRGSIFCVCVKTDFIKGLYELSTVAKPDILIIESTGVANPSDLKRDLKLPIFNNRFEFTEQFCIIDAAHFLDAYNVYTSLEKQIASSSVFIINKTDKSESEKIEEIKRVVSNFHPAPLFYETTYADIPLNELFQIDTEDSDAAAAVSNKEEVLILSAEELEKFINNLFDSPSLQMTPPDLLMSAAYRCNNVNFDLLKESANKFPAELVRAKGFLEEKGIIYIFNYVMGDWTLEKADLEPDRIKHKNILVFIGHPNSMNGIKKALEIGDWVNIGTLQPYAKP